MKSFYSTALVFSLLYGGNLFSQNVGINTDGTAPESGVMLDVKGTSPVATTAVLQNIFQIRSYDATASALKLRLGLKTDATVGLRYGLIDVYDAGAATYPNLAVQPLGGNVGIGLTAPLEKLHVVGNTRISTLAGTGTRMVQADANGTMLPLAAGTASQVLLGTGTWGGIPAGSGNYIQNQTTLQATSNYNISGSGNVQTTYQLQGTNVIMGTANDVYGNIRVLQNNSSTLQDGMYINYNSAGGATADLKFYANGTAERMRILAANGNVGIGTAAPNEQLEITKNFRLPATTATTGIIYSDANRYIHNYGINNFFAGVNAGNLTMTGTNNTAIGFNAFIANTSGFLNTATGIQALLANTTGSYNTATGVQTLQTNITGTNNTANGAAALQNNTEGNYNTAIGVNALLSNVTGSNATAIGYNAMYYANNTATAFTNYNVAVGYEALRGSNVPSTNTGIYNAALGYQALRSNTSGNSNTAIGEEALWANTSGGGNTASGYRALQQNTTGVNNTALGWAAGLIGGNNQCTFIGANTYLTTGRTNVTMLGYGIADAQCTGDGQVCVGNTGVGTIKGQVGFTTYSDARFKTNIKDNVAGLDFILKLKPVTYNEKPTELHKIWGTPDSLVSKIDHSEIERMRFIGFLAQDVERAAKESGFNFPGIDVPKNDNEVYALRYADFIMPMVKAMQEQQSMIEKLKADNEALKTNSETRIEKLEEEMRLLVRLSKEETKK